MWGTPEEHRTGQAQGSPPREKRSSTAHHGGLSDGYSTHCLAEEQAWAQLGEHVVPAAQSARPAWLLPCWQRTTRLHMEEKLREAPASDLVPHLRCLCLASAIRQLFFLPSKLASGWLTPHRWQKRLATPSTTMVSCFRCACRVRRQRRECSEVCESAHPPRGHTSEVWQGAVLSSRCPGRAPLENSSTHATACLQPQLPSLCTSFASATFSRHCQPRGLATAAPSLLPPQNPK